MHVRHALNYNSLRTLAKNNAKFQISSLVSFKFAKIGSSLNTLTCSKGLITVTCSLKQPSYLLQIPIYMTTKVKDMGSIMSYKVNFNRVGLLRDKRHRIRKN